MRRDRPTLARMRELFTWDVATGQVWWRVGRGRSAAGSLAGRINRNGYRELCIDRSFVPCHQAIYFLATNEWVSLIDHINGVRDDNRIENLRAATKADNARNRTNWTHRKLLGAYKTKTSWRAAITSDGVAYHLGTYQTEQAAHDAYCDARARIEQAQFFARRACLEEMQAVKAA